MIKKQNSFHTKICFVSLSSYPLLTNKNLNYVGGAEIQQVELAKELKKRGYEISFITFGEDHKDIKKKFEFEIMPAYSKNEIDNLSFFKKAICIWKKMKEVNADVYIHRSGSPGITSIFGILHQKKTIKLITSDADVTGEIIIKRNNFSGLVEKIGNWLDIKISDVVISQSKFQKSELKRKFGIKSIVIKNAFTIPSKTEIAHTGNDLLWIGTIRSVKRPHLFLEIAKRFPMYDFVMIGGESENSELFKKIKKDSNNIKNLKFVGFVPRDKIFEYYKKAILLINTSKTEGFPNIFLEAWMHFVPIVSLDVDPDGIISKYNLGCHSKTFEQLIDDIKLLLDDGELLHEMRKNGRKYVEANHNIKNIVKQYENSIESLLLHT